jgi:hypothetical protein
MTDKPMKTMLHDSQKINPALSETAHIEKKNFQISVRILNRIKILYGLS